MYEDFAGEYGGDTVVDECGECGGDGSSCAECESDPATWQINPAEYQYNGSVTAAVIINDAQVGSEDDLLAGFVGDEIRGVANGLFFPVTQNYTFNIMLFSNLTDGETISFKYYHSASGEVFCLSETVDFESDMIIANAIAPFTFNLDVEFVLGCNDQSACNYDPTSNFNDGSCEYPEEFYDCDGNCLSDSDTDGICDEEEILGCTNEDALNFNQEATEDDGSCILLGCTDELACNYDESATDDNGTCEYAEEFYDCDGNCIADFDCLGECGDTVNKMNVASVEEMAQAAQNVNLIQQHGK